MIYALNAWFKARIVVVTFLSILVPSYAYVIFSIYRNPDDIKVRDLVFFIIITGYTAGDMIHMLKELCELEVNLISLERCINFSEIPPEANYLNFELHKKFFLYPSKKHIRKIVEDNRDDILFPLGHV